MTSLANKTALITGASRGMGRATAPTKPKQWLIKSAQRVDAPMRFPPISPRLMALTRLPLRSAT
jgi:hypothetical protein